MNQTPDRNNVRKMVYKGLAALPAHAGDGSERAVLSSIDEACTNAASEIGRLLVTCPAWGDLGWFFGQYRGTILSGKRAFRKFYVSHRLGTDTENRYLLGIYWYAYSLGLTVGELFEQRCAAREVILKAGKVELRGGPPFWDVLAVSLDEDDQNKPESLKFVDGARGYGKQASVYELVIPRTWMNALISDEMWAHALQLMQLPEPGVDEDIRTGLLREHAFHTLCQLLSRRRDLLMAQLLWDDGVRGTRNRAAANALVGADDDNMEWLRFQKTTDDAILSQVVASIQLLSLYWRFSVEKTGTAGPLVVCIPKPGKKETSGLQPRFGFASLFAGGTRRATLKTVLELLTPWEDNLDHAADRIFRQGGATLVDDVEKRANELLGRDVAKGLIDKLSDLHLGGKNAVSRLLMRILPFWGEIERAAPGFVHEGHRFAASILIGQEYHEQVLGAPIGPLQPFLQDLKCKVPNGCKGIEAVANRTDAMLFKALVKSCYSLFDWDGVMLFCRLSLEEKKGVEFSSFLRLPESYRSLSMTELCRFLTLRHNGLFAVSVDRGGTIRIYYGGTFLLYKDKSGWKLGSAIETIEHKIRKGLKAIRVSVPDRGDVLKSFANLLLRISEEPGVGALFVVARDEKRAERLSFIAEPPKEIWDKLHPFDAVRPNVDEEMEILYRLAIMDGATLIILGNRGDFEEKWAHAIIKPRRLVTEKFDMDHFWKKKLERGRWGNWVDILSYGTKHNAGLALAIRSSLDRKPLLVIAVSSDGPISFMCGENDPPIEKWPEDKA